MMIAKVAIEMVPERGNIRVRRETQQVVQGKEKKKPRGRPQNALK